ncbi:hypothetical protein Y1Q_0013805 [Alligator mississippiensis]|uniref:Uncharacterized protein n=1 Tax=Alligator mississippiensis TaxID=8496 RepID=A0A151MZG5_ALLMI|nr:hypothetical protein Y1Q_0013805 [Alligator mississippiensis]
MYKLAQAWLHEASPAGRVRGEACGPGPCHTRGTRATSEGLSLAVSELQAVFEAGAAASPLCPVLPPARDRTGPEKTGRAQLAQGGSRQGPGSGEPATKEAGAEVPSWRPWQEARAKVAVTGLDVFAPLMTADGDGRGHWKSQITFNSREGSPIASLLSRSDI